MAKKSYKYAEQKRNENSLPPSPPSLLQSNNLVPILHPSPWRSAGVWQTFFFRCLSSVGETTQSSLLRGETPGAVLWVADSIQRTQKEFCIGEAEEGEGEKGEAANGLLGYTGEERGKSQGLFWRSCVTAVLKRLYAWRCFVPPRLCLFFGVHACKEWRASYLSSMWQELQEVILSKVCIRNSWKLLVAFSGRMFDLRKKEQRHKC